MTGAATVDFWVVAGQEASAELRTMDERDISSGRVCAPMAWLLNPETQRMDYLAERSLMGRVRQSWIRIPHRSVSKEHAMLAYESGGWTLKDLGSRNGTWLNGQRLEPGVTTSAARDSKLKLGDITLVLASVEPPTLCARKETTGSCIVAEGGVLTLPDEEEPVAYAYSPAPGTWVVDLGGQLQELQDGDTLFITGERYRMRVPGTDRRRILESTATTVGQVNLSDLKLRLVVSQDEESIATELLADGYRKPIPPRATHYVLLVLARQRLRDRAEGFADSECGWVYSDQLASMLGTDPQKVNVDVHRLRQQFAKLGVVDAARLVERRTTSHQLRLGVTEIEIV